MTPDTWTQYFKGYTIIDCAVRDRQTFYLLSKENPPPGPAVRDFEMLSRTVSIYADEPESSPDRFAFCDLKMFWHPFIEVTHDPISQLVTLDMMSSVYVDGSGQHGLESNIPDTFGMSVASKARWIDSRLYVAGHPRKVAYRDAPNSWQLLKDGWIPPPEKDAGGVLPYPPTFTDLDGFSRDDLYAVGGKGDVWHWNASGWRQCAFPSNMYLHTVCCAGDGQVYIGAQSGHVFCGREDRWKLIHEDSMTLPFKDMVWFEGRVWCTSDYGVWQIIDGKLQGAQLPGNVWRFAGNLSAADGVLMLAGIHGAAVLEAGRWDVLVDNVEMEKQASRP